MKATQASRKWIQLVPPHFSSTVQTGGEIERYYLQMGPYEVSYMEYTGLDNFKIKVYYPEIIKESRDPFPVLVMVNGTWAESSKYPALFKHLASWGFIVVGNDAGRTWDGVATENSLKCVLSLNGSPGNIFQGKIDVANIGIFGHSQGGVGAINTVTGGCGEIIKTAIVVSPACPKLASKLKWEYDISKITVPVFLLSGKSGVFETRIVSPFKEMEALYKRIHSPKVLICRKKATHWNMLYYAEGYVTAWFMWKLKGDISASSAFVGPLPEVLSNSQYQDQQVAL